LSGQKIIVEEFKHPVKKLDKLGLLDWYFIKNNLGGACGKTSTIYGVFNHSAVSF